MKVQRYAFLDKLKKTRVQNIKEVPLFMCMPMIVLAILCLVMSLMVIPDVRDTFLMPAVNSLISIIK
jgi:NADH:ubiquinone oxidoreductase subunit 5 (subunit L)/multisubunit Na+/H+ antiporter MnhA subunit